MVLDSDIFAMKSYNFSKKELGEVISGFFRQIFWWPVKFRQIFFRLVKIPGKSKLAKKHWFLLYFWEPCELWHFRQISVKIPSQFRHNSVKIPSKFRQITYGIDDARQNFCCSLAYLLKMRRSRVYLGPILDHRKFGFILRPMVL